MNKNIEKLVISIEKKLFLKSNRADVLLTCEWANKYPEEAGIYALFKNDNVIYVGETSSIKGRMSDIRRTVNHAVRRAIGKKVFSKIKGFKKATSKKKFPPHIEVRVDNYMKKLSIAVLSLDFGRKEVEENIISRHSPIFNAKVNKRNKQ